MKKSILVLMLLPFFANAQIFGGNNIIKANLSSLAFGNYHATFERAILKKMSISISYRYGEKKAIPFTKYP
jgi:chemotaxis receptor (MCP) glutamine deamidase CheD